jgi:hypothetical protein
MSTKSWLKNEILLLLPIRILPIPLKSLLFSAIFLAIAWKSDFTLPSDFRDSTTSITGGLASQTFVGQKFCEVETETGENRAYLTKKERRGEPQEFQHGAGRNRYSLCFKNARPQPSCNPISFEFGQEMGFQCLNDSMSQ